MAKRFGFYYPPYKLEFFLTFCCNSRCKTCNIWEIYLKNSSEKAKELKTKEVIQIVRSVKKYLLWISFSGGEPTQREDLEDIAIAIYNECSNLSIMSFSSNGLSPELIEKKFSNIAQACPEIDIFITLSLDGLGKLHDEIRGVKGAFGKVEQSFLYLKEIEKTFKNFHVSYQLTLSKFNAGSFVELFNYAHQKTSMNIISLAYDNVTVTGGKLSVDIRDNGLKFSQIVEEIYRRYPVSELIDIIPKIYLKLAIPYVKTGKSLISCSAGFSNVTINPYGQVLPCENTKLILGDLREWNYNLDDLLKNGEMRKKIKSFKNCRDCWSNCTAYPSMYQSFFKSFYKSLL